MEFKKHHRSKFSIKNTANKKLNLKCRLQWTEIELKILIDNYSSLGAKGCKELLNNKTLQQIQTRAGYMGLTYDGMWSDTELAILVENYKVLGSNVIKLLPGRSRSTIRSKAKNLGLTYMANKWSEEEIDQLKKLYPIYGKKCADILNKSVTSITNKAFQLKLKVVSTNWTEQENAILINNYASCGVEECTKLLPGRAASAIISHAHMLGLKVEPTRKYHRKPFYCIELDKCFDSITEIEQFFNISKDGGMINNICKNNLTNTAQGYHWAYADNLEHINKIKNAKNYTGEKVVTHNISIRCIETGEIFGSICEAAIKYNVASSNGGLHLKGKRNSWGKLSDGTKLHWEYVDKENKDK